ncbi:7914_t:CDS:2 [Gigaspora margarita]|uniref:7914_t:CDS:1 n=1 Tax=Gigaspora margarita TaxID=4874 RepID=A0ABM8W0N5_GIGMA|nr:7914_t:CDS:2 [Gigaspora margarita]
MVNQAQIAKDKSAHRPYKYKLEARKLQEEIVRINGTIYLLERESQTDIEMLHWKLEGSLPCIHKKKSIAREKYNPNKENLPEVKPLTKTGHSNTRERNYRKQEWFTLYQRRGKSLFKLDLMKHNTGDLFNRQGNTKIPRDMSSTSSLSEKTLLEEILKRLSNLKEKQQTSEGYSTSSFQTSRQLYKSCDNSAASNGKKNSNNNIAPSTEEGKNSKTYKAIVQLNKWIRKGKKNQTQKIDVALRKEMTYSIREINKKLNIEIASVEEHCSSKLI